MQRKLSASGRRWSLKEALDDMTLYGFDARVGGIFLLSFG